MQSSNLFAALIVTFFQQHIQFGVTFNYMQWTSEKCLSEERISNPRNSVWQAGLFQNWIHSWANTFQELSCIRLWINLRARRRLQRHRYRKTDWKAYSHFRFHFLKSCEGTIFPFQLWLSSSRYFLYWCSWKFSSPKQSSNEKFVLWHRDDDTY